MKTFIKTAAAGILLSMLSCTKIEQNAVVPQRIGYQTVVAVPTRAVDGVVYDTSIPFKSAAFWNPDGDALRASSTLWMPESDVSFTDSAWATAKDYYWPVSGGSLTFLSYSPAYVDMQIGRDGISLDWDASDIDNRSADLMVAEIQTGRRPAVTGVSEAVPTVFHHILSQIKVSAVVEDSSRIRITSVSFTNVNTKAHFSAYMRGGEWGEMRHLWTGLKERATVGVEMEPILLSSDYRQIGDIYMAIPQVTNSPGKEVRMIVTYDNLSTSQTGLSVSLTLSEFGSSKWGRAKKVHYMLSFGQSDKPIAFAASDEDWEEPYHENMTIGADIQSQSFGIYGYYSAVAGDRKNKFNVFASAKPVEVRHADGAQAWDYGPSQYWKRNFNYRFRAYWPYKASVLESASDADNMIIEYRIDEHDYDLMLAYSTRNPAADGFGTVELCFQHALCALNFSVDFGEDNPETDTVENFYVKGIASYGHMKYNSTAQSSSNILKRKDWTAVYENKYEHYVWKGSEGHNSHMVFAIPQEILEGRTVVHFRTKGQGGEVDHTVTIPAIEWEPGKIYNYNFLVKESEIGLDVVVKPWTIKSSTIVVEIV